MKADNDNNPPFKALDAEDPLAALRGRWIPNPERRFSVPDGVVDYLVLIGKISTVNGLYNWGETIDAINEFNDSAESNEPLWRLTAIHHGEAPWRAAQRMDRPHQWIYFIGTDEAVKIGTSVSPRSRIRELQTGNWHALALLGYMPGGVLTEAEIHRLLADLHIRGEWYRHEDDLRDFISENCTHKEAA